MKLLIITKIINLIPALALNVLKGILERSKTVFNKFRSSAIYSIIMLYANALAGMESQTIALCHKRETLQTPIFMHLLERNKINTEGIVILHPECSTGILSAALAEKAD